MKRPEQIRAALIALLIVAAVLSVVGNKMNQPWIGWISFVAFLCAVALYFDWRRRLRAGRRGKVFAQEAKTRKARTRSDK
ncbi:MAG TPA: hypothetical protein VGH52_11250 [Gaiellaceae bacterium]|jgi:uncharacterized membrane protein YfcA